MPFTGSHAAAVLPLMGSPRLRRRLAPSALVIGSMSPDLPYFVQAPVPVALTHSAQGVVGIDLALGLLAVVLWHGLVAPAAVSVAPACVRRRTGAPLAVRALRPVPVVLGLLVGALTHVVWDSFSHAGRFGTQHIAWLAQQHGPLEGYRWAQYASGLVGGVLVMAAVSVWWRSAPVGPDPGGAGQRAAALTWTAVAAATVVGAAAGATSAQGDGLRLVMFAIATVGGGAGGAAALLCAIALRTPRLGAQTRDLTPPRGSDA